MIRYNLIFFLLTTVLSGCDNWKEGKTPAHATNYQAGIDNLNDAFNISKASLLFHLDSIHKKGKISGSYVIIPADDSREFTSGIDTVLIDADSFPNIKAEVTIEVEANAYDGYLQHNQELTPISKGGYFVYFELMVNETSSRTEDKYQFTKFKIKSKGDDYGIVIQ